MEQQVVAAYWEEVEKSKQPGYVPPVLDGEDIEIYDLAPSRNSPRPRTASGNMAVHG
jgi:hypothetical protein